LLLYLVFIVVIIRILAHFLDCASKIVVLAPAR